MGGLFEGRLLLTLNQYFGVFFDSNVFLEFKSNKKEIYIVT